VDRILATQREKRHSCGSHLSYAEGKETLLWIAPSATHRKDPYTGGWHSSKKKDILPVPFDFHIFCSFFYVIIVPNLWNCCTMLCGRNEHREIKIKDLDALVFRVDHPVLLSE
jgi:hypothetical protein